MYAVAKETPYICESHLRTEDLINNLRSVDEREKKSFNNSLIEVRLLACCTKLEVISKIC